MQIFANGKRRFDSFMEFYVFLLLLLLLVNTSQKQRRYLQYYRY